MDKQIKFGWLLPTGTQRMPAERFAYETHVRSILDLIHGRFHSAWIPDHLMHGQGEIPEALVTLSYLSSLYPQLHFGPLVLSQSYRNPALLAKMGATLQHLSGGRFVMGIGAGWKEDEYRAYGFDFPKPSVRIAQTAEVIQICRAMWDPQQPTATFTGQYYQVENAVCLPKPVPSPPIMIGGGGEKLTLRVVAQHADWWNLPGAPPHEYARKLAILEQHCDGIGRDPQQIRKTWAGVVSIARTGAAAEKQMEHYKIWPGDIPLLGTTDDVRKQLQAYIDLGVSLFILAFVDEPRLDGLNMFFHEVLEK